MTSDDSERSFEGAGQDSESDDVMVGQSLLETMMAMKIADDTGQDVELVLPARDEYPDECRIPDFSDGGLEGGETDCSDRICEPARKLEALRDSVGNALMMSNQPKRRLVDVLANMSSAVADTDIEFSRETELDNPKRDVVFE